jgi:hypothetical protein
MMDSISFHIVHVHAMGQQLLASAILPSLKSGVVNADDYSGGIIPCSKLTAKACEKG